MTDPTAPAPGSDDDLPRAQADGVVPDTKDWTWVLDQPCPECGLAAGDVEVADVGGLVRDFVPRWRGALGRDDVRVRPGPGVWSVLEYGAHVRDVFRVFDERLALILAQDDPRFPNWDQDAAAVAGEYGRQDPAVVADELDAAGRVVADRFDGVLAEQEGREGLRSNGSVFTVRTLGQYFVHDVVHHLHDVGA